MTVTNKHPAHRDVTYIGKEDPFVDRNYGSNLDFVPGQSRTVPAALAARFLLHTDCFEESKGETEAAKAAAKLADDNAKKSEKQLKDELKAKEQEDTDAKLAEQQRLEDERRKREDAIFEQHNLIDGLKKAELLDFIKDNYKEVVDSKRTVPDLRAHAKSLVDAQGII